jgi:hypothetical protein
LGKFIDPLPEGVEERKLGYQTPHFDFEQFQGERGRFVAKPSPRFEAERILLGQRGKL